MQRCLNSEVCLLTLACVSRGCVPASPCCMVGYEGQKHLLQQLSSRDAGYESNFLMMDVSDLSWT